MKLFKTSLRAKIIGLVLGVTIVSSIGAIYNIEQFVSQYEIQVEKTLEADTEFLTQAISAQLFERYGDVQAFALNPAIAELNAGEMQPILDSYVSLYGIYDLIVVLDKDGKLVASNLKDPSGKPIENIHKLKSYPFSNEEWFKKTLASEFSMDKENNYNGTYIEDFIWDPTTELVFGESRFGSSFSSQIKNAKGEVIGVISNRAGSRWFESEIANIHKKLGNKMSKRTHFHLFDESGKMVAHSFFDESSNDQQKFNREKDRILNHSIYDIHPDLSALLKNQQQGFALYVDPETNQQAIGAFTKSSDSKTIAGHKWYALVEVGSKEALASARELKQTGFLIAAAVGFLGLIFAVWFGIFISKSISQVTNVLSTNADEVSDASVKIASGATELSESATEQAAALQETVAAVDEISAMVEKNAEAAQKSREVSQQSREAANRGREIVSSMIHAIQEIDRSNDEVSQQMDESNKQLSEITKLINDISNKTKVINEIVFQTKLLSFNASVEAARAGEYGKGFAVVAEEVGNLAQMSGNAAKEITGLLEESVQKVNAIVSDSKTKVDRLMASSKEKVINGSKTAQECTVSLEDILSQVQTVDSLVSEIALASQEQSTGIREVSKAIGQMEQVTQQNTAVSQTSSVSAEQLRAQSEVLNSIVKDLALIVNGVDQVQRNSPRTSHPARTMDVKNEAHVPNKVVKFPTKEKTFKAEKSEPLARASGGDFTPSGDDPGFSE